MDEVIALRYPSMRAAATVLEKLIVTRKEGPLTQADIFRLIGVTGVRGSNEILELPPMRVEHDSDGYFLAPIPNC